MFYGANSLVDGVVKLWDVRTRAVINEIKGLGEAFTLAWHPNGDFLLVGNKVCSPQLTGFVAITIFNKLMYPG